jgi:hypothetical protein
MKPDTDPDPDPDPDDAAAAQARLEAALRASRVLEDAPEAVIQRAIGLWSAPARQAPATGLRERLVAVLSFDSAGASPLAFGRRSAGADMRQLLFSAGERDIDLRVSPAGAGRWRVAGQVFGPDTAGRARVEVAGVVAECAWNELAEWQVDALPAGDCRVVLSSDGWEIELPPFALG